MRPILVVIICLAILGCGPSVKFFPLNEPPDAILADRVEVLSQFPARPYVSVGLIKVRARSSLASSPEKMMRMLKEKARQVGADAIVVTSLTGETVVTGVVNGGRGGVSSTTKDVMTATAIAWK